jgi:hypothetical protein
LFKNNAEHERFYQEIAKEVGLEGWEGDRLLYKHRDEFLAIIEASREDPATVPGNSSGSQDDPPTHQSTKWSSGATGCPWAVQ